MKLFIKILLFTFSSGIAFSQAGWVPQNSGITTTLNSVKFANSNTGWCVGNAGIILKTTDGGANWLQQSSGFNINLSSEYFLNENTGFAVGDSALILKTTNGGNIWFKINTTTTDFFKSVFFVNENVGYTGGHRDDPENSFKTVNLYKTVNGGLQWDSIQIFGSDHINSIYFLSSELGWATFGYSGTLSGEKVGKTTNSGIDWDYQYSSSIFPKAKDVFFIDSLNGWLSYKSSVTYPTILRTTNSGANWITEFPGTGYSANSLYFINTKKGWAAAENRVIQATTNGGINWINQTNFQPGINYNSVYFTDSLNGWTVGDSGTILKTTTGGVLTSFTNQSTEIPDKYFLSQNYPNPFNLGTIISYSIPVNVKSERSTSQGGSKVKLIVYSSLGNEVATLVNERKNAGSYEVEFNGSNFSSGIYFYSLTVDGNLIDTKKMILLK